LKRISLIFSSLSINKIRAHTLIFFNVIQKLAICNRQGFIPFRLLENYGSVTGQTISVNDLIERYHKATPDKENYLAHFEICRILKKIFPNIKEAKIKVSFKDFPTQINTLANLDNILYLVALNDLCRGFPVVSERKSRNRNG